MKPQCWNKNNAPVFHGHYYYNFTSLPKEQQDASNVELILYSNLTEIQNAVKRNNLVIISLELSAADIVNHNYKISELQAAVNAAGSKNVAYVKIMEEPHEKYKASYPTRRQQMRGDLETAINSLKSQVSGVKYGIDFGTNFGDGGCDIGGKVYGWHPIPNDPSTYVCREITVGPDDNYYRSYFGDKWGFPQNLDYYQFNFYPWLSAYNYFTHRCPIPKTENDEPAFEAELLTLINDVSPVLPTNALIILTGQLIHRSCTDPTNKGPFTWPPENAPIWYKNRILNTSSPWNRLQGILWWSWDQITNENVPNFKTNIKNMGNEITRPFCDVSYNHPMFCHIRFIYEYGITTGCGNQNYCPNDYVSRKTMAVFLVKAIDENPSTVPYNAYFDDIVNDGYAGYINRVKELGITTGCGTRRYCPENLVTRAEMAVFIIKALQNEPGFGSEPVCGGVLCKDTTSYFTDVPSTHWAFKFIQKIKYENITGGCSVSPPKYCPDDLVTRAQMAVFLTRMVEIRKDITACP